MCMYYVIYASLPKVTKGCFLEAFKILCLKTFKQHESPGIKDFLDQTESTPNPDLKPSWPQRSSGMAWQLPWGDSGPQSRPEGA